MPGIRDMPEFLTGESVAARQKSGPYGAKGVGETGTFGVSPAIAEITKVLFPGSMYEDELVTLTPSARKTEDRVSLRPVNPGFRSARTA
jgi:hypothetical protein